MAAFAHYREVEKKIRDDEEALADPDLRELAEAELPELSGERGKLEQSIQLLLLPADPNDKKNTILEIRSGGDGEEASALRRGPLPHVRALPPSVRAGESRC